MATALAEPEVVEIHDDGEGPLFEIVDGVRVEKTMSMVAQWSGSQISRLVANYIEDDGPGGFVVTETFIACFDWAPGTKRRPDVAYWHAHQFPDGLPERGEATIAPAWCIEVVSPGDNAE
ncbi:MAG: Uma2 family endonuclease, partial [Planctomycetota bacterium]